MAKSRCWKRSWRPRGASRSFIALSRGWRPNTHCSTTTAMGLARRAIGSAAFEHRNVPKTALRSMATAPGSLVLIRSDREQCIPAELRAERDRLELAVAELRDRKEQTPDDEYFLKLEMLLVELARLQERVDLLAK
jgi:hypothetical protein